MTEIERISSASPEPLLSRSIRENFKPKLKLDTLTRTQIIGYGIGHFQNDLCAAIWFNYLLYFMKNVVFAKEDDSGFYAGIVLLSGQIADGLATPLVGYFSDKTNTRLGKRIPWYIFGTILVTSCFLFIFQKCAMCGWFSTNCPEITILNYVFFPAAFNIGWASVQVAHMSLVPSLTLSRKTRDRLNNLRNTFTYIANLFVLVLAFFIFYAVRQAYEQFMIITRASLAVGLATAIFFLITVQEKKITQDCRKIKREFQKQLSLNSQTSLDAAKLDKLEKMILNRQTSLQPLSSPDSAMACSPGTDVEKWELSEDEDSGKVHFSRSRRKTDLESHADELVYWKQWFRVPAFYIYGFVYMACRLLVNVQSSLLIFYLQIVLRIGPGVDLSDGLPVEFALIPMIVYLASSITSTLLKHLYEKIGRKRTFTIGTIAALIGVSVMAFLDSSTQYVMFPLAAIIGVGQSISLNTGISLIGEVVGVKGASGAFVFGAYSLLDKFMSGIVLYAVINIRDVSLVANEPYLRICTVAIPGVAITFAWILIMLGKAKDYDSEDAIIEHPDSDTGDIDVGRVSAN